MTTLLLIIILSMGSFVITYDFYKYIKELRQIIKEKKKRNKTRQK